MKKITSTSLFVLSLLLVVLSVVCAIYAIYDIDRISNDLANDPSASGIDFMGIGWGYGIILFVLSIFGLILSAVNIKQLSKKALRYTAVAEIAVSAVLIIVSIFIFYGTGNPRPKTLNLLSFQSDRRFLKKILLKSY